MPDKRILDVVERYRQKWEAMPNGRFGFTLGFEDPQLKIMSLGRIKGDLLCESERFRDGYNCARVANEAGALLKDHFAINRALTITPSGTQQHYLEVEDPEEGWIDLDATPWYGTTGNIHDKEKDEELIIDPRRNMCELNGTNDNFLSLWKNDRGSVDIYFGGGHRTIGDHLKRVGHFTNPQYSFRMSATYKDNDKNIRSRIALYLYISESSFFPTISQLNNWQDHPRQYLDSLLQDLGFVITLANEELDGVENPDLMISKIRRNLSQLDEYEGDDRICADYIIKTLPSLANIVSKLQPIIETPLGDVIDLNNILPPDCY